MQTVIRMPLEDGGSVSIELSDESEAVVEPVGRAGNVAAATVRTLRETLSDVSAAANEVVTQFRETAAQPDKVTVQFGVKLTGEATAVIAKAAAEANFTIIAEWQRAGTEPDS